jgi:hypothetical protein
VEADEDTDAEWSGSSRGRRKIRAQDQVDGGEEVCFGRCHRNLCSEGRRAEEKEEDEGCISSGRRYSNDSDASLAGGRSEDEEEEEKTRRRRMRPSKSCRSLKTRRRGGQRVLLPRGSESWCRRRRRKLSNVV